MTVVIGNLINEAGGKTYIVNGIDDHVHCFWSIKPSLSVSHIIQSAKGNSSKWLNEQGFLAERFEWQEGFGCFTYAHSQKDRVYKYVTNQEAHHQAIKFLDEYTAMLNTFDVAYDKQYIFYEPLWGTRD